jgi:hypothetical protein
LALTNVARFAEAMVRLGMPADQRSEVRLALADLAGSDTEGAKVHATKLIELLDTAGPEPVDQFSAAIVVPHRFAGSVIALVDAGTEWLALGATDAGKGVFQPAVMLFGGWLPGSAQVSAAASTERGAHWADRIRLAPYTRAAIQMGIAVGLATALGVVVDSYRFYWAVIAVFVTFMGVNNSGEQARKALFRVGGTVVGIGIGSLIAEAVGHHTYLSITVILASLFLGLYLMRINYAFMVVAITVMVSQLYVQLGEFSNSLLVVRLEETALGAAVAIAVVMLVLPLRTRRVLRVAFRDHIQAVGALIEHATSRLLSDEADIDTTLHADGRSIDATYQALLATAQPLRRNLFGSVDEDTGRAMRLAFASRNYSRNLVADVEATGPLDTELRSDIENGITTLQRSMGALAGAVTGPRDVTYTRSSALFDGAERYLETSPIGMDNGRLAIRDLKLIDGAMAGMAEVMAINISDYDTVA